MSTFTKSNWNATAAGHKTILLPDKFLCRECKKFKPPMQFSNNELKEYRFKVLNRTPVSGITVQIRCRNCTGDQAQELQCTGPCDLWKGLDDFSKNQRRQPENAWCMTCTQWKEASEPGITPLAAPNSLLSPDEEKLVAESEAGVTSCSSDNIEGDADSDDEGGVAFLYGPMAAMGPGASEDDSSLAASTGFGDEIQTIGTGSVGYIPTIPAYLSRTNVKCPTSNKQSSVSNPYETRSESARTTVPQDNSEYQETDAGVSKDTSYGNHLQKYGAGWPRKDTKIHRPGVMYNGWDNAGKVHTQVRTLSQSTTTGDTDVVQDKPVTHQRSSRTVGGWATPASTRNPLVQFPTLSRPVQQQNYDEEEDSPDEI